MTLFQVKSLDSQQHQQTAFLAYAAFVGYVLLRLKLKLEWRFSNFFRIFMLLKTYVEKLHKLILKTQDLKLYFSVILLERKMKYTNAINLSLGGFLLPWIYLKKIQMNSEYTPFFLYTIKKRIYWSPRCRQRCYEYDLFSLNATYSILTK